MPELEDAILLALEAHGGKCDRGCAPYILHPLRVMLRMKIRSEMMAAVLHDVVENSPVSVADLRGAGYPPEVCDAVDGLTWRKKGGESYEAFIERLSGSPLAVKVKLADLEDNMDIRRIGEPSDKDWKRLQRYHRAWSRLRREVSLSGTVADREEKATRQT